MDDLDGLDEIIEGLASDEEQPPPCSADDGAEVDTGTWVDQPPPSRVKPLEKWLKDEILTEVLRLSEQASTPEQADFVKKMGAVKKMKKPSLKKTLRSMWKLGLGGPDQGPLIDDGAEPEPEPAQTGPSETVYVAMKPDRNVLDPPKKSRKLDEGALDQLGEQMAAFNLIVVHTLEGVSQQVRPSGYVIEGAAEKLAQPPVHAQVKECMKEIAAEVGPDDPVIKTMSNPWFKYAVLMTSVLASSAKKADAVEEPQQAEAAGTVRQ